MNMRNERSYKQFRYQTSV